jgi:hypothetical protein
MRYLPALMPLDAALDANISVPVAPAIATNACVSEKTPLTNRIGRHSARIKAVKRHDR